MTPNQIEQQPRPNQELEQLEKKLKEKGYVVEKKSQRGKKIDIVINNNLGKQGGGEGYTYEIALKNAIRALDYIIKNEL